MMATPVGELIINEIARRSTAGFRSIEIRSREAPGKTSPSVIAATSGAPVRGGARLQRRDRPHAQRRPRALLLAALSARAGASPPGAPVPSTRPIKKVGGLDPGRRVWWRARLRRGGESAVGPVRSFRVLPVGGGRARIAVASCGSQFGPIFERIADSEPDTFVWQGDLNYPDTHGPLAQSMTGYAGIWRDFLANPLLGTDPRAERRSRPSGMTTTTAFRTPTRRTSSASRSASPHGRRSWAGAPTTASPRERPSSGCSTSGATRATRVLPDSRDKTLLGARQRRWLLRTLAASEAPFKVICSPCTVFMAGNARDGNWARGLRRGA